MKGGYKLIDFKKVDITEEDVVIDGIFNSINSTTKRVVATNLNIGGFELKELELSVVGDEGSYLLQCPFFKIMITDEDSVSCEVFTNQNYSTKKIYCHPIDILFSQYGRVCCFIFNNDETPFTVDSFVKWVEDLYLLVGDGIKVLLSGVICYNNEIYPASLLVRRANGEFALASRKSDNTNLTVVFTDANTFKTEISSLNDGVNAIN